MSDISERIERLTPLQQATLTIKKLRSKLDEVERAQREPIAIVGMACRFPGGIRSPRDYWRLLHDGVDAITEVPPERWDVDAYYDPDPSVPGKSYARHGGFLDNIDRFDPQFFGVSPREAAGIDPQQRLLLELSWEALENAGHAPERLHRSQTGVFIGIAGNEYLQITRKPDVAEIDPYAGTGNLQSAAAGRISFLLGLHGPALAVDTACSSSLVAVHLACESLRSKGCNLAIAGGVNLMLSPEPSVFLCRAQALAADGRCKTFDASADGYVRGEGCGAVVLKRLADAEAAGDRILAVVRGSAVNHDGPSSGFTVPNGLAQEAVIRGALANAGVDPLDISYVEAHGTGTSLGDPIEMRALVSALCKNRSAGHPLTIGSVKTNIGHLEGAAGIASLIKVVLSLQHHEIPPHLHFKTLNPHAELNGAPIRVPVEPTTWAVPDKRIACVASFGLSGTNSYAVVEEAPAAARGVSPTSNSPLYVMPLSAKAPGALNDLALQFAEHLESTKEDRLEDVCYTAGAGRSHFANRLAVIGQTREEISGRLKAAAAGSTAPGVYSVPNPLKQPKIAFLFTGQGSQYTGMGRQLYETQPVFRAALERCDSLLGPLGGRSLLSVIYPPDGQSSPLDQTMYTQPGLFAIEYALAELWRSWGVEPSAVLGHSVGEYVAACVAGVLSLEDGLRLIGQRAELMQSLPHGGAMAAIFADESHVAGALGPEHSDVSIAAVNGPANTVISGSGRAVQIVLDRCERLGIRYQPLTVSHAFHSHLMDPILDSFERRAAMIQYSEPRLTLISNLTGKAAEAATVNPHYWRNHIRESVRFAPGVEALKRLGYQVFVEIGPAPVLLGMAKNCFPEPAAVWLPSLRRGRSDWQQLMESLASLYVNGAKIDWKAVAWGENARAVELPTYPFQRERYWLDARSAVRGAGVHTATGGVDSSAHPLLGSRLRLPFSKDTRFERRFSAVSPAYLNDHRLFGIAVAPAASHLSMALAAAAEIFGPGPCTLEDVIFSQPLVLPENASRTVQMIVSTEAENRASFRVVSAGSDEEGGISEDWVLHCEGKLRAGIDATTAESTPLTEIQARCRQQSSGPEFYAEYGKIGYNLGPSFLWLGPIWQGPGEALCSMQKPATLNGDDSYSLHPGLIDSCFQLLACGYGGDPEKALQGDSIAIPFSIARLHFRGSSQQDLWCHAALREREEAPPGTTLGDISLFEPGGEIIARVEGLYGRQTSRQALARAQRTNISSWLYQIDWKLAPTAAPPARLDQHTAGKWLIFADRDGVAHHLAPALRSRGESVILVNAGNNYEKIESDKFRLDPENPEDYSRILADLAPGDYRGVVHLWSLEGPSADTLTPALLDHAQSFGSRAVLLLLQAFAGAKWRLSSGLWLVTRGAQQVRNSEPLPSIAQAPMWGIGRVISLEQPELLCGRIDLDPKSIIEEQIDALMDTLLSTTADREFAFRRGARYVPRLARSPGRASGSEQHPVRLEVTAPGEIDKLATRPKSRVRPAAGEVEIRVYASGLNFRDVLNALGMYPGDPGPLGSECAGEIVAVGEGVDAFSPGDEVFAVAPGAFSTFVTAPAQFVVRKPDGLSLEQAAAIPIAFLTAYYGLHHLAGPSTGQKILIHAAAGGVGLAAVQLAQRAGAEIFATAGRPEKRDFLRSLGVQHVMDSRSLTFADEIGEITSGRGVDVVLNSLVGESIPKSMSVLAPGGWFLEIGKREILQPEQVEAIKPGVNYQAYDLGEIGLNMPELFRSMLLELAADFAAGTLQPLPIEVFALEDAAAAFRYMAQAKHIGKIVVSQPRETPASEPAQIRANATYLITGGLGALGLEVARWMVDQGAKTLVLTGRTPASSAVKESLLAIEQGGVRIVEHCADVSQPAEMERLFNRIEAELPPLRGIVHAAGVLDDGILLQQSPARFASVMAPKVAGAWNLHSLARNSPLDFFILFSSTASVFGSAGQGNYAAANAFLDALAHYRRGAGLPGLSINWGPWSGRGMAATRGKGRERRWASQGIGMIAPEQGLQAMEQLLVSATPQVSVVPVNWPQFTRQFAGHIPPLISGLVRSTSGTTAAQSQPSVNAQLIEALKNAPPKERPELLLAYIQQQIIKVLGLDSSHRFDSQQPLAELGLDSLMAVELRNALSNALGISLPPTVLFDFPTLDALTVYLIDKVLGLGAAPSAPEAQPRNNDELESLLHNVEELSEEEIQKSLRATKGASA